MEKGQQKSKGKRINKLIQTELFEDNKNYPNWDVEELLSQKGYSIIAGCDDAGRGPIAGPVFAGCVIFKKKIKIPFLTDSKKLSPKKRKLIFETITNSEDILFSYASCSVEEIDKLNIFNAANLAMKRAVTKLINLPDAVIVDGNSLIKGLPMYQMNVVKGDYKCYSIAAASIIAKVMRDELMEQLSKKYPQYEFEKHKGYCTKRHIELLKKYGPSDVHRKSFEPVKSFYGKF